MNQLCKVCGEPAAGFHFGAFTCEGCKSFFGRTYNNISAIAGCKNNGDCVINKKNRTACKACRLRKCLLVGMSKSGSRYGRRSNWFKIHCLLQEQQSQNQPQLSTTFEQLNHLHHQLHVQQTYQDKTNPSIKTAQLSPPVHPYLPAQFLSTTMPLSKSEPRLSSPSDSGASFADPEEHILQRENETSPAISKSFIQSIRSSSEPLKLFTPFNSKVANYVKMPTYPTASIPPMLEGSVQEEPIDLSINSRSECKSKSASTPTLDLPKPAPLDLTLVRTQPMSG